MNEQRPTTPGSRSEAFEVWWYDYRIKNSLGDHTAKAEVAEAAFSAGIKAEKGSRAASSEIAPLDSNADLIRMLRNEAALTDSICMNELLRQAADALDPLKNAAPQEKQPSSTEAAAPAGNGVEADRADVPAVAARSSNKNEQSPTPRTKAERIALWLEDAANDGFTSASAGDQHSFRVAAALIRSLSSELAEGHRICDDLLRVNKELRADLASAIANHAADLSAQSAIAPRWTPTYRGEEDGWQTWVSAPPPCWLLLDDVLHPDRAHWAVYWDGVGYPVNCTSYRVIGYYQTPLPPRDSVCGPVDGGGQHG